MDEYEGGWITTYTGNRFCFTDPKPEQVHIEDIAHHLSLICRFTGAVKSFYSVADHSIRVAGIVPDELKLSALLHDAAEAYTGDISRPVKYSHKLETTEKAVMEVIARKYNIDPYNPIVREADNKLLATEARDLMPNMTGWAKLPEPLSMTIEPASSHVAEIYFMFLFRKLGGDGPLGVGWRGWYG